jgi:hypothetical protein
VGWVPASNVTICLLTTVESDQTPSIYIRLMLDPVSSGLYPLPIMVAWTILMCDTHRIPCPGHNSVSDVLQLNRPISACQIKCGNGDQFMSNPNRLHLRQFTPSSFSPKKIRHDRTMFQLLAVSVSLIPDCSLDDTYFLEE